MLAIKNNIMAGNAARHLGKAYDSLAKSVERLSSGLRINSAKDDAAGLAVRELIRADVAVLRQGSRNASDGISMLQTMEGAMAVMDENLIRMKELAEQAATESYSDAQRTIMNAEFAEMSAEIERISSATEFNDINLLNNTSTVSIHVGTTTTVDITGQDMTASSLGIEVGTSGITVQTMGVDGEDAATTADWLSIAGHADTYADGIVLTINFIDNTVSETAIVVTLTAGDGATTDYSLQQVADAINTVTQNLGNDANGNNLNYSSASVILDTTATKYVLKLSSRTAGADDVTIASAKLGSIDVTTSGAFNSDTDGNIADLLSTGSTDFSTTGTAGAGINIDSVDAAVSALVTIDAAITTKDTARAAFGYKMNRLESTISILDVQSENLAAAESRISDVDVATEMATLTRTQVLSQAGVSMLAQANSMPQMALTLLR